MTAPAEIALRMHAIEKRFGASVALAGVDFDVRPGEAHALIGENGAGKSTLMKVLSGAYQPDAGRMELEGRPFAPRDPLDAQRLGIAMIYQELTLAVHLTVEQNVVLGREPRRWGVVDRGAMRASVEEALGWLDQPELRPDRLVADLPPGARQLVEVARALASHAKVVVMDEPTSSLSKPEAERLFEVIDRLRGRGVAVVYISHFLEEVRRVAQRYTVLRDGRTVETRAVPGRGAERASASEPPERSGDPGAPASDGVEGFAGAKPPEHEDAAFIAHVVQAMAGRALEAAFPHVPHEPGDVIVEIENLAGPKLPRRASLAVRRGEILGIAGLVGAGRTEMLRAMFGLDEVRSGRIKVGGTWDAGRSPRERLDQGVGLLSENRKEEGLALGLSISDNLTLSRPVARFGMISRAAHRRATTDAARQLSLRYRDDRQPVGELSGGNQQKVALARLLHHDIDVFLFDEPTRGIDVGSKAEIYRLMGQLAQRGKSMVFVSSYLPELLGVCDRIAVMSRGRLGDARPVSAWTEHALLEAATAGGRG